MNAVGLQDTAMDTGGGEDKKNTNPAVNVDPVTKPNTLGACLKVCYHYSCRGISNYIM